MKNIYFFFTLTFLLSFLPNTYGQDCDASFSAVVSGCNVVSFIPNVVNPSYTYHWDFGDGNTSTVSNPVHTFVSYGNNTKVFTVRLNLSFEGCSEQTSKTVTVKQVPDAKIVDNSGNDFLDCGNGVLIISNGSSTKSSNTLYKIAWGYNDKTESYNAFTDLITHEYPRKGNYILRTEVTGDNGCVTVDSTPYIWSTTPNIGLELPSNDDICLPGFAKVIRASSKTQAPSLKI